MSNQSAYLSSSVAVEQTNAEQTNAEQTNVEQPPVDAQQPNTNPTTILKRIQNGMAYMYEASKQKEFLKWWEKTSWGKQMLENLSKGVESRNQKLSDPRWGSTNRTAQQWSNYGQGALVRNGKPFVYCLTCDAALQHPRAFGVGTSHMTSHLKSTKCMKSSVRPRETVHAMLSKV